MLYTLVVLLVVLWLVGNVSAYTFGGLIHLLLLVALIVFVLQVLSGRRNVAR